MSSTKSSRGSRATKSATRATKRGAIRDNGGARKPKPPFPSQHQPKPGLESQLEPRPKYEAPSYRGSGKLDGRVALITGGDSGIGRAVAVLYAREGADVAIVYLPEEQSDAEETRDAVSGEGTRCLLIPGDVRDPAAPQPLHAARLEIHEVRRVMDDPHLVRFLVSDAGAAVDEPRHIGNLAHRHLCYSC